MNLRPTGSTITMLKPWQVILVVSLMLLLLPLACLARRYIYRVELAPGQKLRGVVPTRPADVQRLTRLLADEDWLVDNGKQNW